MLLSATHNLGTCRMSDDPDTGVVNAWGRAHEIDNLFISDGSQFTTSTCENPTLTIVALGIRQGGAYCRRDAAAESMSPERLLVGRENSNLWSSPRFPYTREHGPAQEKRAPSTGDTP